MTNINTRSIILMWWSTDPKHFGGLPVQRDQAVAELLESTPFRGTPRQVITEIERIRRNIGSAYCRFEFRTVKRHTVTKEALHDLFTEAESPMPVRRDIQRERKC